LLGLLVSVYAVADPEEEFKNKIKIRPSLSLSLAEFYFLECGAAEGHLQLDRVLCQDPETDAEFEARKRITAQMIEDAIPEEDAAASATWTVLRALRNDGPTEAQMSDLIESTAASFREKGKDFEAEIVKALGRAFILGMTGKRKESAALGRATMEKLDLSGPPRQGEYAQFIAALWYGLGVLYQGLGQMEDSLWAYGQATTRYPYTSCGAHAFLRRGSLLIRSDPVAAEAEFRVPLDGRSYDALWEAHYYLGDFLVQQGREIEALPYLEAFLIERAPYTEERQPFAEKLYDKIVAGSALAKVSGASLGKDKKAKTGAGGDEKGRVLLALANCWGGRQEP